MFTGILWTLLVLETFLMGASQNTCKEHHFQQVYCRNPNVYQVDLMYKQNQSNTYYVKLMEFYKGMPDRFAPDYTGYINVITKVNLLNRDGKKFVIFGHFKPGMFVTDDCAGVLQWNKLTSYQQNAVVEFYGPDCNCFPLIPKFSDRTACFWRYGYFLFEEKACRIKGGGLLQICQQDRRLAEFKKHM